mgnify:FL=1
MADFLTYLFEVKKLAVSSISGYRSVLSTTLREVSGVELTDNLHLTKLISSFYLERPKDRNPFPTWDLSLVLSRLLRGPFEPLRSAEPKFLSMKTAFLLALATAKRRSELRAFSKRVLHTDNWTSVTLRPLPNFVAKTEVPGRPETRLQDVTIPALAPFVGPDLAIDSKNCPVRAVKIYLARTQEKRGNRQELFIPYKPGALGSISPATISSWIKKTVIFAYQDASTVEAASLQVRAHDLRALAASWNLHSSVRLTDIMKAAQWRSHNTFTSFYLKDMTLYEEDILKLGPLVTAQTVTNC